MSKLHSTRQTRPGWVSSVRWLTLLILMCGVVPAQAAQRANASPAQPLVGLDCRYPLTSQYRTELVVLANTLYFRGCDATHGSELWKSDGTAAGTALVADLTTTPCTFQPSFPPCSSTPTGLTTQGDTLFFFAWGSADGPALWRSHGTAQGIV